jgi:hypothetical protein
VRICANAVLAVLGLPTLTACTDYRILAEPVDAPSLIGAAGGAPSASFAQAPAPAVNPLVVIVEGGHVRKGGS